METFRLTGDDRHLYFRNLERLSGREELASVMKILNANGCQIADRIVGPDCTLYPCKMNGYRFAVCDESIDGDGISLCVDDEKTMEYLEEIFKEKVQ